jgi:hypothetical protein
VSKETRDELLIGQFTILFAILEEEEEETMGQHG